jgi:hypothetical protein
MMHAPFDGGEKMERKKKMGRVFEETIKMERWTNILGILK